MCLCVARRCPSLHFRTKSLHSLDTTGPAAPGGSSSSIRPLGTGAALLSRPRRPLLGGPSLLRLWTVTLAFYGAAFEHKDRTQALSKHHNHITSAARSAVPGEGRGSGPLVVQGCQCTSPTKCRQGLAQPRSQSCICAGTPERLSYKSRSILQIGVVLQVNPALKKPLVSIQQCPLVYVALRSARLCGATCIHELEAA